MFTCAMLMRVAEGALKRLTPEKGLEVRESRHGIKNFGLLSVGDSGIRHTVQARMSSTFTCGNVTNQLTTGARALCLTRARAFLPQIVNSEIRTAGTRNGAQTLSGQEVGACGQMSALVTTFFEPPLLFRMGNGMPNASTLKSSSFHKGTGSPIEQTESACPCCDQHTHRSAAKRPRVGPQALVDLFYGHPRGCERP